MTSGLSLALLLACSKSNPDASAAPLASASAAVVAPAGPLREGDAAPNVVLPLDDGTTVTLSSLRGKPVALYFYPKDDTPGCTIEAKGIRDSWDDFKKENVVVFGISTQDAASHKAFIEKHQLPFRLVVDAESKVAKAFGVP